MNEKEQYYISLFNPHLNGTNVKSYIRKKAQPNAELKRIFQVVNRKTTLFPSVRSVILGYYKKLDEEEMKEYTVLVVLVNSNDHYNIILGSVMRSQKRQGSHLKYFWITSTCDCELDESRYSPVTFFAFMIDDYVYEFICCSELRESLKETPSKLYQVELFNQSVTALRSPDTITEIPTNTYRSSSPDGRLQLNKVDYLNYYIPKLQPVDEFLETFL